jgi:hypothetical protein
MSIRFTASLNPEGKYYIFLMLLPPKTENGDEKEIHEH